MSYLEGSVSEETDHEYIDRSALENRTHRTIIYYSPKLPATAAVPKTSDKNKVSKCINCTKVEMEINDII